MEDYKKRAKEMGDAKNEKSYITLTEGDNCLRLHNVPEGEDPDLSPPVVVEYQIHYQVGANKISCTCGHRKSLKKKCWLCDKKIPELRKAGKAGRAEALAPTLALGVCASKVTEDDDGHLKFGEPKLWNPSGKVQGAILTQILASKKRDYVDRKRGYNINITRTGTGFKGTRYGSVIPDDEPSKVPSSIVAMVKPFDQLIPAYDEDRQKAAYAGKEYEPKDVGSSSSSASGSASSEAESGLEGILSSEENTKEKKKMAVKKVAATKKKANKKAKDSASDSASAEDSASASASASASDSASASASASNSASDSASASASSDSASASDSASSSSEEVKTSKKKKPVVVDKKKKKKKK